MAHILTAPGRPRKAPSDKVVLIGPIWKFAGRALGGEELVYMRRYLQKSEKQSKWGGLRRRWTHGLEATLQFEDEPNSLAGIKEQCYCV